MNRLMQQMASTSAGRRTVTLLFYRRRPCMMQ
jgi:hypothetical protein